MKKMFLRWWHRGMLWDWYCWTTDKYVTGALTRNKITQEQACKRVQWIINASNLEPINKSITEDGML